MRRLAGGVVALLVALAPAAAAQQYPPQPGASAGGSAEVDGGVATVSGRAAVTAEDGRVDADASVDVGGAVLSRSDSPLEDGSLTATGSELAALGLVGALALAVGSGSVLRQRRSSRTIAS